jgi:hypothetical protein
MKWAEHVARMGVKNGQKIIFEKYDGNRLFGRLRHRWENNIKIDLKEIVVRVWIRFICISIGFSGRLL